VIQPCQQKLYAGFVDRKAKALAAAVGKRIKERRGELKMSQRAMQDATGLMHGYISRIEQGKVEVCLGTIQVVCETLGISIAELFKGL
jgi:transcriptional regulator with XRE-family HTH domain